MAEPGHKRTSRSAACSRRAPLKRRRTRARKHNNKQVPLGAGAGSDEGGLALAECSRPKRRRVTARGVESAAAAADFSWRPILVPFVIGSRDRPRAAATAPVRGQLFAPSRAAGVSAHLRASAERKQRRQRAAREREREDYRWPCVLRNEGAVFISRPRYKCMHGCGRPATPTRGRNSPPGAGESNLMIALELSRAGNRRRRRRRERTG